MMPYFSLKSLAFMNEILRYNATIQINLLVEFLYGTIQFLRILPKKI